MKNTQIPLLLIRPVLYILLPLIIYTNSYAQNLIGDTNGNENYYKKLKSSYSDAQINYLLSKEIIPNIPKRKQSFKGYRKDFRDYNFLPYSKDNGEMGFKNKEGDIVIRAKFDDVSSFYINDKSNLKITTVKKKDVVRLINEKGQYVTDNKFSYINQGYSKYFRFYKQNIADRWGILDYSGNVLTEPKFQKIILVATLQDSIETEIKLFVGVVNDKIGSYEFSIQENNNSVVQTIQEPQFDKIYDLTGQSIELPEFIYWHPDPSDFFYEPSVYVQKKANKYNLYCRSCSGKSFFDSESYDSIAPIEVLIDGNKDQLLLRVKKENKWGIVNLNGNYQADAEYEMILPFKNGFAEIFKNSKKGIINKHGKVLLNPEFDEINQFTRDLKLVKSTSKTGIVNNFYEAIVTPDEGVEINLRQNFVYIKKEGKYGLITPNGNYLKPVYDSIGSFASNSTAYIFQNNMRGIIDSEGKFIIPIAYKSIEQFGYQLYKVFDGRFYGLYSMTGQKKSETEFDEITLSESGKYLKTRKVDNLGLLENGSCNVLFSPLYQSIEQINNNKFVVSQKGKYGLYKNELNPIIPIEYDSIISWGIDDYVIVGIENKFQLAKLNPFEMISSRYDLINHFQDGYSTVMLNSKWGAINEKGELFIPVMYDTSFIFIDNKASVKQGSKIFLVNKKNEFFYNNYQGSKLSEITDGGQNALTVVVDTYRKLLNYNMSKNTLNNSTYLNVFTSNSTDIKTALKKVLGGELTEKQNSEFEDTIKAINKEFIASLKSQGDHANCRLCGDRFTHEGYSSRESGDGRIVIWEGKNGSQVEAPMYRERYNPSGSITGEIVGNAIAKEWDNKYKPKVTKKYQADYCSTNCAQSGALRGLKSIY
jgi:hypothetical protein